MRIYRVLYLFIILLLPLDAFCQPGDPDGGDVPGGVPLTGVEWLLLAGGALGIKKIYDVRKKREK